MKVNVKRLGKRAVSIILCLMMLVATMAIGITTVSADMSVSGGVGKIYFDNTVTGWTDNYIQILIGHNSYSTSYTMSKVENTNLYYYDLGTQFTDAKQFAIIGHSAEFGATTSSQSPSARYNYANHYTGIYSSNSYTFTNTKYTLITPSAKANGSSINTPESLGTSASSANTSLNRVNITLKTKVSSDGVNYADTSDALGTLNISTYQFANSAVSSVTQKSTSYTANVSTATFNSAAYSADTSFTATAASGYQFDGFYDSNGNKITTSFKATASATYYAYFSKTSSTVSATAKYRTWDTASGKLNTTLNTGTTGGTVVANPTTVDQNGSSEFTATEASGYSFKGWYTDANCTTLKDSNTPYTLTGITQNTELFGLFEQNAPDTSSVTFTASNTAAVSKIEYTSNNGQSPYVGQDVTVKVTAKSNQYECGDVTISGTTVTKTVNGLEYTYSFTMPNSPVSVTVPITEKTPVSFVTTVYPTGGGSMNTISGTYYVGDTVNISATENEGYAFKNWTVSGGTPASATSASTTLTIDSTEVSITANFEDDLGTEMTDRFLLFNIGDSTPYNLGGGSNYATIYKKTDGTYIAKFTDAQIATFNNNKNTNIYFGLASAKSVGSTGDYLYWQKDSTVSVSTTDSSLAAAGKTSGYNMTNGNSIILGYFNVQEDLAGLTIKVGVDDGAGHVSSPDYEVRPVSDIPAGTVKAYAKQGIQYLDEATSGGGWKDIGETTLKKVDNKVIAKGSGNRYNNYYVMPGTTIEITTKLTDNANALTYYVAGWSVNGDTVNVTSDLGNGEFVGSYKVPADVTSVEITPCYLNQTIKDYGDYISVYVDMSEVEENAAADWGNTIACYPYYYSSDSTGNRESKGKYPGQPMLLDSNGKYKTSIEKCYWKIDGTNITKSDIVASGLTFNNYTSTNVDSVHHTLNSSLGNKQSYDYNEFAYLALMKDIAVIQFDMQYNATDTGSNYSFLMKAHGQTGISDTNNPTSNTSYLEADMTNASWKTLFTHEWDDLIDYEGANQKRIDIYGNVLADDKQAASTTPEIYIVSVGDRDLNATYNGVTYNVGDWATIWYVYDSSGKYIAKGIPSDFLARTADEGSSTYYSGAYSRLATYNYGTGANQPANADVISALKDKYTVITFDYDKDYGSGTTRLDGRWYYQLDKTVTVNVTTQLVADGSDASSVGCKATIDGATSKQFNLNDVGTLSATPGNGYKFVGWYEKNKDGTLTPLALTERSGEFSVDADYNIVCKFDEVASGSLVITHSKYTGEDAEGGLGAYSLKVTVGDTPYEGTDSVTITNYTENDTITIQLITECYGKNTFENWYEYDAEKGKYTKLYPDYDSTIYTGQKADPANPYGQSGTVSLTYETTGWALINSNTKSLNFYSDIRTIGGTCTIYYQYVDRFNIDPSQQYVTYTVKGVKVDSKNIENNTYQPTDEQIKQNAPYANTLTSKVKWILSDSYVDRNGTGYATVTAYQEPREYSVTYSTTYIAAGDTTTDRLYTTISEMFSYNSLLKTADGGYYAVVPDELVSKFSYWQVYTMDGFDANGDPIKKSKVARCYNTKFNLRVLDNYYIEAVYDTKADEYYASVDAPVYNREVYGEAASATDMLYVDLMVAYTAEGIPVLSEYAGNEYTIECGVILDRSNTITTKGSTAAFNIDNYAINWDFDRAATFAQNKEKTNGGYELYQVENSNLDGGEERHTLIKYTADASALTNKNRVDMVLKYVNNEKNSNYIYRVYSYIVVRNKSDDSVKGFYISAPEDSQYFNFSDIAGLKGEFEKTTV